MGELFGGVGPYALLRVVKKLLGLGGEGVGGVVGHLPAVLAPEPSPRTLFADFAAEQNPVPLGGVEVERVHARARGQVGVEGLPRLAAIGRAIVLLALGEDEGHAEVVRVFYYKGGLSFGNALHLGPGGTLVSAAPDIFARSVVVEDALGLRVSLSLFDVSDVLIKGSVQWNRQSKRGATANDLGR